ncbi:nucleoside deaminase [Candidatus Nomurabacteria bacterium]|nr:nucleoside deaminase [Candidatus Nomurabacteria bacterium]
MTDEDFMKLAVEEANNAQENGELPIGAVIVKNGRVISKGRSSTWPKKDPSAHGETESIRNACKVLGSLDLSGCTMYGTLEPCTACLGTAAWASLPRAVFGCFSSDVPDNPYEYENYSAIEHSKHLRLYLGGKIEVIGGILRDECTELMRPVKDWQMQDY